MTSSEPDVLVIGAGVSGLTTAVCLAEAGAAVKISAALPPDRTTSAVAGAIGGRTWSGWMTASSAGARPPWPACWS